MRERQNSWGEFYFGKRTRGFYYFPEAMYHF